MRGPPTAYGRAWPSAKSQTHCCPREPRQWPPCAAQGPRPPPPPSEAEDASIETPGPLDADAPGAPRVLYPRRGWQAPRVNRVLLDLA
eukprot:3353355-Pyramimonas_sp.AAC.1